VKKINSSKVRKILEPARINSLLARIRKRIWISNWNRIPV